MPIYEYQCDQCDEVTEALQKFSDAPLAQCPHCGGRLHKLMSLNAFHLKGGGWYVSDYKGKNASTGQPAGDAAAKPAKTETKSTTEAAPKSAA